MSFDPSRSWNSLNNRQEIMDIVDQISLGLKERIRDEADNPARVINVDNISFTTEEGSDFVEHSVTAYIGSDQGKYEQGLIIRQFRTDVIFRNELEYSNKIELKQLEIPNFAIFPILYVEKNSRIIVYEDVAGISFNELTLQAENKYYLLGRIHAIFHDEIRNDLDENTIREFTIFLLLNLPMTPEERDGVGQVLERHFSRIADSLGGISIPFDLGINNLRFQQLTENLSTQHIRQNQGIKTFLGPRSTENLVQDRLFDLAQIFANNAFDEYILTGEVLRTKELISYYVSGYLDINLQDTSIIKQMYPKGLTLDLYFLTSIWLDELEKAQSSDIDPTIIEDRPFLVFSYYVLAEEPFSRSFGIY